MKTVIQRVNSASVTIKNKVYSKINSGLLVLLGIAATDTIKEINFICEKILNLRIFEDMHGKMNKSVTEKNGEILVVSQFTLYGNCQKGRRPGFDQAAKPDIAIPIYEQFIETLKISYPNKIFNGQFGAYMKVNIENNGPVTFILEK